MRVSLPFDTRQRNALNKGTLREKEQHNNRRDHHRGSGHQCPPVGFDPAEKPITGQSPACTAHGRPGRLAGQ